MIDYRSALAILALLPVAAASGSGAQATEAVCFEVVIPQRPMQLDSPLRVNKCTGETWILVRSYNVNKGKGRVVYRWVALETENKPQAGNGGSVASAPKREAPRADDKCFEFAGRRYC
jgi:hypothetical protein